MENKNDEKFRTLVEHVSDWIWEVDENGVYIYASPRIEDILGYPPSEIIGKTPFDLMPVEEAERIGPIFQYHVENKLPIKSLENINIHRDGYEVVLETSGLPIINDEGKCIGYRGMDRDITLRKQNERRQKQLLEIIEASPDFVATFDIQGNSLYYNSAARTILGIQETDDNNKKDRWLTERIINKGIPTAIEKGHWKGETVITKEDGTEIPVSQIIVAHKSENGTVEFLSTIAHDITERKELERFVYRQAHYDALTNLPNRRYLDKKFAEMMDNLTEQEKIALFFIDLDNFKEINDTLGHEIGDQLLKITANRLETCLDEHDFICRYGGDEFVLLFDHIQQDADVQKKKERIISALQEPAHIDHHAIKISGSIGVSMYSYDGTDLNTLIKKADNAMYRVKRERKND